MVQEVLLTLSKIKKKKYYYQYIELCFLFVFLSTDVGPLPLKPSVLNHHVSTVAVDRAIDAFCLF